jgi:hypothetical protein
MCVRIVAHHEVESYTNKNNGCACMCVFTYSIPTTHQKNICAYMSFYMHIYTYTCIISMVVLIQNRNMVFLVWVWVFRTQTWLEPGSESEYSRQEDGCMPRHEGSQVPTNTHVCIHAHTLTRTCPRVFRTPTHKQTRTCMHVCMHTCTDMLPYVLNTHTQAEDMLPGVFNTHTQANTHVYACMHAYTHGPWRGHVRVCWDESWRPARGCVHV